MGIGLAPLIGTETDTDIIPFEETDPKREYKAHIINPPANLHIWRDPMTSQDIVDVARTTGQFVVALCGYKFIPKHNPDKLDACLTCMDIAGHLMREGGE